jgi:hypothetical protein
MRPLSLPVRGGSIESLAPFVNLASENDFVLVVASLLEALRAGGRYPVLPQPANKGQRRPCSRAPEDADRPKRGAGAGPAAR